MNMDLYFVPILETALNQIDRKSALADAFRSIQQLGREPGYQKGYRQFCAFMAAVVETTGLAEFVEDGPSDIRAFQQELGLLLRALGDEPSLVADRERFRKRVGGIPEHLRDLLEHVHGEARPIELRLEKEQRVVAVINIRDERESALADHLTPGCFTLSTDTNRVLWEGELSASDLLWESAFPGRPLELAADSDAASRVQPTRQISLLDGDIELLVFAGLVYGHLRIVYHPWKGESDRGSGR
jgi:hypothetical protein